MADVPAFYHPAPAGYPARSMSVTGFAFNPATRTVDFSAVPGFDLSRLEMLIHAKTGACLYGRPYARYFAFGLAAVDGVAVPAPSSTGKVLTVKTDCAGMSAADEILAFYDRPNGD